MRAKFQIESVADLRQSLRRLGSDLVVRVGRPESVIEALSSQGLEIDSVFLHKDVAYEEVQVEAKIKKTCSEKKIEFKPFWGGLTLHHVDDLPFPIHGKGSDVLNVFTMFRKSVENSDKPPRAPLDTPGQIPQLPSGISCGDIPTIAELLQLGDNLEFWESNKGTFSIPHGVDASKVNSFTGGESVALNHLDQYIWKRELITTYKDTRNGLVGMDYSSKFSVWLANGCLSPRTIFAEISKFEKQRVANDSTYWLVFELLWRDFFKFLTLKHGHKIFQLSGLKDVYGGKDKSWKTDTNLFQRWADGRTGYSFVDANMRELNATGFMSNRGRQNVASFLTKDLFIDWRMGAEYFESLLLDHDPCSNFGNWLYVAGVGTDPREDRYFNVVKQGFMYDAKAEYVTLWFPQLKDLPSTDLKHRPFLLSVPQQEKYLVRVGQEWPHPVSHVKYNSEDTQSGKSTGSRGSQPTTKSWKVHRPNQQRGGGWSRNRK
eukprot:TRINITY_DN2180_c0_g1_i2.p1 TRINITY_DN2180_c0_g1~~TRINITY_DN2180_c0_g1_i2.p1  ORF type:complete len:488 (+),score=48.84 TRINITY_DN2180_c0_g1_i2:489-1952(+)